MFFNLFCFSTSLLWHKWPWKHLLHFLLNISFLYKGRFFNEQHKRIIMALHSSPLVECCLFVFFFIVVLITYIFQNFVRGSFCSLSAWRQVLLGRLPLPELPELLYIASSPHAHPPRTCYGPDQALIGHQIVKCPRKTPPWKSVVDR